MSFWGEGPGGGGEGDGGMGRIDVLGNWGPCIFLGGILGILVRD